LVKALILARFESGFDSAALVAGIEQCNLPGLPRVDFMIKWNSRTTNVGALGSRLGADGNTRWTRTDALIWRRFDDGVVMFGRKTACEASAGYQGHGFRLEE